MRSFLALGLLVAVTGAPAWAARPPLRIADMARIVNLEEPAISPDGRTVALIAISQDMREAAYVDALVLVNAETGTTRTLVRGRDVAVPRWSPDGVRLAYLARSASDSIEQVYLRGRDGRTVQLTHARADVIDFAWSPAGERIAYVAAEPQKPSGYFFAGDNDYTATALTPPDHLWVVSAAGGRAQRVTHGSWTIAATDPGGIFSPQIAWTHDGRHITFTRVENTFSGDDERSTLWQADLATGALRKLTSHPEFELTPAYSPDGAYLAYWYPLDGDFNSETTIRLFDGRTDRRLAPSLDRNVAGMLWYPGARKMLVCATDRTRTLAWTIALDGTVHPLALGSLNIVCDPYSSSTFDAGPAASIARDGSLAFIATDATHARELYYLAAGSSVPRQLTHINAFLAQRTLGRMTEFDWEGPGGFHEDGVVTYPPSNSGLKANKKYPVVVLIHGGPGLSSTTDFVWEQWPLAQAIAAHGYVVFQPNYRGSDNLGNAFMHAIVHDTVVGPSADIMAGLAALERLPTIDASRIAVSGWSYGGELTSWLIGHYRLWRAAVSGAAVNSEFDEYNLSTSNVQDRYPLGASPYTGDGPRIYRDNSPITYYANITTPTLIWGTTLDPVVPIPQAYALFHALRDNHVPVRFAVFPAATHGPATPVQTAELTRLWIAWLDRYMK